MYSLFPESALVQTCAKCGFPRTSFEFYNNNDWCKPCLKKAGLAAPLGQRFCTRCKDYFLIADMESHEVYGKLRVSSWCRGCSRERNRLAMKKNYNAMKRRNENLLKNYGITLIEYERLLEEQGGVCAMCHREETMVNYRTRQIGPLTVDHDHTTGRVRGLLCQTCNRTLGFLGEDPERVQAMLVYIYERVLV